MTDRMAKTMGILFRPRGLVQAALLSLYALPAFGNIELRVSVKFVLGPGGARPGERVSDPNCESLGCSVINWRAEVEEKSDYANEVLARLGSGYRFQVVEAEDVPGLEAYRDAEVGNPTRQAIDDVAMAAPGTYLFRSDAINICVINDDPASAECGAGYASRAPGHAILIGQRLRGGHVRPFHECGHYFSLCHTYGTCLVPSGPACADDCLADTITNDSSWDSADAIATGHFGMTYAELDCAQREEVRYVLYNVMSYHQDNDGYIARGTSQLPIACGNVPPPNLCRHRLTPDQLDLLTDLANTLRNNVATGCTHLVDATAYPGDLFGHNACGAVWLCDFDGDGDEDDWCSDLDDNGTVEEYTLAGPPPRQRSDLAGNSARPYPTVAGALLHAGSNDIVMIRGGSYDEILTLDEPVTLRAPRGDA